LNNFGGRGVDGLVLGGFRCGGRRRVWRDGGSGLILPNGRIHKRLIDRQARWLFDSRLDSIFLILDGGRYCRVFLDCDGGVRRGGRFFDRGSFDRFEVLFLDELILFSLGLFDGFEMFFAGELLFLYELVFRDRFSGSGWTCLGPLRDEFLLFELVGGVILALDGAGFDGSRRGFRGGLGLATAMSGDRFAGQKAAAVPLDGGLNQGRRLEGAGRTGR
jgi:hypothetical protein